MHRHARDLVAQRRKRVRQHREVRHERTPTQLAIGIYVALAARTLAPRSAPRAARTRARWWCERARMVVFARTCARAHCARPGRSNRHQPLRTLTGSPPVFLLRRLLDIHVEHGALWLIFEHLECDLHHFLASTNEGTCARARLPRATRDVARLRALVCNSRSSRCVRRAARMKSRLALHAAAVCMPALNRACGAYFSDCGPTSCSPFRAPHRAPSAPRARAGLPLSAVRPLLYQLLLAVHYCHANRVLHRDIKPHNVLMRRTPSGEIGANGARPWTLKLADFGLARVFNLPLRAYTHEVVTLWYRAPEILLGMRTYSWSVDIWSVACLLAEMLSGKPLFPGDSEIDQLMRIFRGLGTPDAAGWPAVAALPEWKTCYPKWRPQPFGELVPALSDNAAGQDLLSRMLRYDPDERITAFDALDHPFFDGLDKELFHAAARR